MSTQLTQFWHCLNGILGIGKTEKKTLERLFTSSIDFHEYKTSSDSSYLNVRYINGRIVHAVHEGASGASVVIVDVDRERLTRAVGAADLEPVILSTD